jgi:PBP1b-binding outer membrane lipoprotein LpoB
MNLFKTKSQFLVLFLAILFASCVYEPIDGTVDPDSNSGGSINSGVFKADFSGKTWTATETLAVISGNYIEISAINAKGESFGIMIEGATVGTYAANVNIVVYSPAGSEYGYWSLNDNNPSEDTGSVSITEIDTEKKTISGTFKFKGYWSDPDTPKSPINFTNGVFNDIPYITQEETNDVFTAKVDGVNFLNTDILTSEIGINSQDWIAIGAEDSNMNVISISIKSDLIAGTYPITINRLSDDVQASYEDVDGEYEAISGSVTITSITTDRVKGSFQFTTNGTPSFTITEGNFDVEY